MPHCWKSDNAAHIVIYVAGKIGFRSVDRKHKNEPTQQRLTIETLRNFAMISIDCIPFQIKEKYSLAEISLRADT